MHILAPARIQWSLVAFRSLKFSVGGQKCQQAKTWPLAFHLPSSVPVWPVHLPIVSDSHKAGLGFFHLGLRKRVNVFERLNPSVELLEPLKHENTFPVPGLSSAADLVRDPAATPALGSQTRMGFALFFLLQSRNPFPTAVWEQVLISQKNWFYLWGRGAS